MKQTMYKCDFVDCKVELHVLNKIGEKHYCDNHAQWVCSSNTTKTDELKRKLDITMEMVSVLINKVDRLVVLNSLSTEEK